MIKTRREKNREAQARWKASHREEYNKRMLSYYNSNKEMINAKRRAAYALKKKGRVQQL